MEGRGDLCREKRNPRAALWGLGRSAYAVGWGTTKSLSKVPFSWYSIRLRSATGIAEIPSTVSAYAEEPLHEKFFLEAFQGAYSIFRISDRAPGPRSADRNHFSGWIF